MRRIYCLFAAVVFISSPSYAGCNSIACDNEYIERLYVTENIVYIDMSGDMTALGCVLSSNKFVRLPKTHGAYDEIYALLLATQTAGRRLGRLRINSGESTCTVAYAWQDHSNIDVTP